MTEFRRASLLAAMLVSIVLAVVACGGAAATPTPTPTPVGEAAPPADATPTPEPTPVGEETPTFAIPSFDLGSLTGAIPGVDSYRTSYSVGGVEQYGTVVVTKPVLSKAITTLNDDGTVDSRLIVIGTDVWQADGADGAFEVVPGALGSSMLLAFDPTMMLGAFANLPWANAATDKGTESKNGVQARHLRIDPGTLPAFASVFPAGASVDIWVAEAGYVVGWEMAGFDSGQDVSIQVTNVNDPANKVEKPA